MTLPDTPRPTRPTRYYSRCLLGAQVFVAVLAISAFAAGVLVHQGWIWAGIVLVVMIPLVALTVQEQLRDQRRILRQWALVPAEITKVQNSGGESSQVTLYLSYEWNGRAQEGTMSVKDNNPIDLKLPIWLLVNPDKAKEYRILAEITLVEIDPSSQANSLGAAELPPHHGDDDPL